MNQTKYNNTTINTTSKGAFIDDVFVPYKKGMKGNSVSIINGKVYVDGHEMKNGKWKMTLIGIWNWLF